MVLGKLNIYIEKDCLLPLLLPLRHKIQWIIGLNMKSKIKLPGDIIGKYSHDLMVGKDFKVEKTPLLPSWVNSEAFHNLSALVSSSVK